MAIKLSVHLIIGVLFFLLFAFVFVNSMLNQEKTNGNDNLNQSVTQPEDIKRDINITDDGLSARIFPAEDRKIKGEISVEINSVPRDASRMLIILSPKGMPDTKDVFNQSDVIAEFVDISVEVVFLNTTRVKNGRYNLALSVAPKQSIGDYPWIAVAQTEVIVEN